MLLAIDWSVIGPKALQFIMSFSILVTLHELGHYLTARWFKCRVDKFYLFFNPWFSLWKKKIGDTEYGIGWVPFGGYVKIAGMVDESMDKEQMKQPAQPYEFRSKPAWQRLIIMVGGVIVNVILAIVIFIFISWKWGDEYVPGANLKYGVAVDSLGKKINMQDGDKIVAIAGVPYERVGTAASEIITRGAKEITIERNGAQKTLAIPEGFIEQLNKNHGAGFSKPRFPLVVDSITSQAKITGGSVSKGDTLIGVNGQPIVYWTDIQTDDSALKNKNVALVFKHANGDTVHVQAAYDAEGNNFINYKGMGEVLGSHKTTYTFLEAIPAGWNKCWETLGRYIQSLGQLFTNKEVKVNDSLGSVLSIGSAFSGDLSDWQQFWAMTGIFSILLAFMNILPIPALDGGHALFCISEMITRRKPSDKFMEYAQMTGMVLLLSLMVYALGLDFWRYIFK